MSTKRTRAKKDDVELRINEIIKLIFNGYNVYNLLDEFGKEWGITSIQQMYIYYNKALERIQEINNETIRQNLQFEINRLEEQLRDAKGPENRRLRLDITKEINKLKGLYITKVDLETAIPITINIVKPE